VLVAMSVTCGGTHRSGYERSDVWPCRSVVDLLQREKRGVAGLVWHAATSLDPDCSTVRMPHPLRCIARPLSGWNGMACRALGFGSSLACKVARRAISGCCKYSVPAVASLRRCVGALYLMLVRGKPVYLYTATFYLHLHGCSTS
jgi:hypothetical protein